MGAGVRRAGASALLLLIIVLCVASCVFLLWRTQQLQTRVADLSVDIGTLQQRLAATEQALAAARAPKPAIVSKQKFKPVELELHPGSAIGDPDAPVTMIEFTDYQCPYCRRHATRVAPQLVAAYVDTGKLRYQVRQIPVESSHPQAFKAAEAALCAGDQGAYWPMHERLFAHQTELAPAQLLEHAGSLGLDAEAFRACLDGDSKRQQVRDDIRAGQQAGMRGTPAFFLGLTHSAGEGHILATAILHGAADFSQFAARIDELLLKAGPAGGAQAADSPMK